ncbi:integral membrane protein 2B-like [Aphis craccivora]|uniref:Integral membrane protein 2 n=1 Tax=Aphis craccivora TaxID=307492 RepID=A0A6G0ZHN9_APHCR|nr:integral membrane protein 2B-like [Aphis craccivora]
MTVLTFPSVGAKPDKVPLIDDAEVRGQDKTRPPPMFHPKFLEAGGVGSLPHSNGKPFIPRIHPCTEYKRMAEKMTRITTIVVGIMLILYFTIDTLCKSYVQDIQQKHQATEDEAAAAAAVAAAASAAEPYKSYSSYAAAESDMLTMPSPSSPDPDSQIITLFSMVIKGDRPVKTLPKAPPIIVNKSARFVHDFSINITGIIDVENRRCFVMPLLRNYVHPPEALFELLYRMSSGYYSVDINKILSDYRMVQPAINDLSDYGLYISKDCADFATYKLEKDVVTESP